MLKLILLSFSLLTFFSCETKKYEQGNGNHSLVGSDSKLISDLKFSGISAVSNVTDSSATITWEKVEEAKEYHILLLEDDSTQLFARVPSEESEFTLINLKSDQIYEIQVKAMDKNEILDDNEVKIAIKTLAGPGDNLGMTLVEPSNVNHYILNPKIQISGLLQGEEVTLYSDNCFSEVAKGIVLSDNILLESKDLTPDVSYQFHVKVKNSKGVESDCSTVFVSYNLSSCPDGYVRAPSGNSIGVEDFCVMKYEAKAWFDVDEDNFVDALEIDEDGCNEFGCLTKNWGVGSLLPGSRESGLPWRMIGIDGAKSACRSLGEGFDLISNREWILLAEDIEKQSENWSSGVVGSGCLYRGNNGVNDVCGYEQGSLDYGDPAFRNLKATFKLSNGNKIYDFAGNVAEWVSWGNEGDLTVDNFNCSDPWSEITINFCNGEINAIEFLPRNPAGISDLLYNSDYGLGQLEGGNGNVLARGGSLTHGLYAGIYSGSFSHLQSSASADIGFRCVFRRSHL